MPDPESNPVRRRAAIWIAAVAAAACAAPPLDPAAAEVLAREPALTTPQRSLTGTWANDAGERLLLVQAGEAVVLLPLAGKAQEDMHFAEGVLDGERLGVVGYRQGIPTATSVGAFDVRGVRTASLDRGAETLTFAAGGRFRRVDSVPGHGGLTGVWSGPEGRVAVAHEGDLLVACPIDAASRQDWTSAFACTDPAGRVRMLRLHGGQVNRREVGRTDAAHATIDWPGGRRWTLEAPLLGAPPAAPVPLSPAADGRLANAVDGTLRWAFDWSDVAGASEYRIEVVLGNAARPFLVREQLAQSQYEHVQSGGCVNAETGTWRVAAKVGQAWTDWSTRTRFCIDDNQDTP